MLSKCGRVPPAAKTSGGGVFTTRVPSPPSRLLNSDFRGVLLSFHISDQFLKQFLCIGNWRTDLLFISPKKFLLYSKNLKGKNI